MKSMMVRLIVGTGLILSALPAVAQDPDGGWRRPARHDYDNSSEVRLWVGGFRPAESSDYWRNVRSDFTGSQPQDLDDVIVGADFILRLNRYWGLMFSGGYYSGSTDQAYRNFVDNNNGPIRHQQGLELGTFTVGAIVHLAPGSMVNPYLGAGGGIYTYRLREDGDFIDFTQPSLPVFHAVNTSSGSTIGAYALAGLDFRVAHSASLFVEGRYAWAQKDLGGDFDNFGKIDLSGAQVNGGVSFHLR